MGSNSSKTNAAEPSSSSSFSSSIPRSRSKGSRVFQSSCLGPAPGSHDSDNDEQVSKCRSKETGCNDASANRIESEPDLVKAECCRKVTAEEPDETTCISSSPELDEWRRLNLADTVSRAVNGSSRASSARSSSSSRLLSRLGCNASFRLRRATSSGSSRAYRLSSRRFTISNEGEELHLHPGLARDSVNRNVSSRARDLLPACLIHRSPSPKHNEFPSSSIDSNPTTSGCFDNFQHDQITSAPYGDRDVNNPRVEFNVNLHSTRNDTDAHNVDTRPTDRRIGAREPVERNVRFSRTLSVGRLRDRGHRRSTFPDLILSPLHQERELRDFSQHGGTLALGVETGPLASNENDLTSSTSSVFASSDVSMSLYNDQDYAVETSRARDSRYYDLLEHRSNFLERRRRIRSQVRALQRLGSRFENLSGHERSCIISGQHRAGHCTCHIRTPGANSNDDSNARASISRIVMLAEALFEVLDEIHQQSVSLPSRSSVSSIGSVPAPNEIVESLPVKLYTKPHKHLNEDAAQCYICLVEYEEGDSMRELPCHHEFHRTCVDKWLKEIHRVCPLCRGDICRPDPASSEM